MNTAIIQPGKSPGCGVEPWWLFPDFETEKKASLGKAEREGVKRVLHRRLAGGQTRAEQRADGCVGAVEFCRPVAIHFSQKFRGYFSYIPLFFSFLPSSSCEDFDFPPLIAWFCVSPLFIWGFWFASSHCLALGWEGTAEAISEFHHFQRNPPTIFPVLTGLTLSPAGLGNGKEGSTIRLLFLL